MAGAAADPLDGPDGDELVGNLFDNMEDDSVVVIHRFDPQTARQVLMYKMLPSEATDIEIQRLSGGGKYIIREQVRNEHGQMVWGRQRTVQVAGPAKHVTDMPQSYSPETASTAGSRNESAVEVGLTGPTSRDAIIDAGLLQFFKDMQEQSRSTQEHNRAMAEATRAQAHREPTDWTPFVPIGLALIKLFAKGDAGPNPLDIATQIAALMKENTSTTSAFKDMLETINEVVDLKERTAGPPADPLTTLTAMLPRVLDIIADEQKTHPGQPINEATVQRRLQEAQKKPPPQGNPPEMWRVMLHKFKGLLLRWAKEGLEPAAAGESILNLLEQKHHGALREFLGRDDAPALVFQAIPELRQYEQWTADTFGWLTEQFFPTDEPEEEDRDVETFEVVDEDEGEPVVEAERVDD